MKTKRIPISLVLLLIISGLLSCKLKQDFVQVKGVNFTIKYRPYYFVGTNFWYGAYLGADAVYGNRDRLIRELDQMQKLGIKNLRIAAASEESDFGLPLSPAFQKKNGRYNEKLLQGLDYLLFEMRKRDMRAVLILNNYWDWTGGMSEYVSWATNKPVVDPATNKSQTWDEFMKFSASFYTNEKAQTLYRKYIGMLVYRKNVYSKKLYKNDPTIMAWELANEPRPLNVGNLDNNIKVFANWVDTMASYIHSIAPNQLVTTGSEGTKGTLNSVDYAFKANQSRYIDYITFHIWPKNWGWYKADQPETFGITKKNTLQYIKEHLNLATKLNKPGVIEEFGFVRDRETFSPDSTTKARDNYYALMFQLFTDSLKAGKPIGGINFWGWGGEGRGQHKDYRWKKGDSIYTADPYSETQGLNSIFNTDTSTLKIISKYAAEINKPHLSSRKEK